MPTQNRNYKAARKQAREAFGRMIRKWREGNGWSQYTGEAWAKAAEFDPMSHSGLSPLESGATKSPSPATFGHFAEMNRRLRAQDFSGVKDHGLLAQLSEARPMLDDDGELLEEERLYGIHTGVRRVPAAYWVPPQSDVPELADTDALQLCKEWRRLVRAEAARRGSGLVGCLSDLGELVPDQHRVLLLDVLVGASNYGAHELTRLWDGCEFLPQAWLNSWLAKPGPDATLAGGGAVTSLTNF